MGKDCKVSSKGEREREEVVCFDRGVEEVGARTFSWEGSFLEIETGWVVWLVVQQCVQLVVVCVLAPVCWWAVGFVGGRR